jgi:hypothetical protein
MAALSPEKLLIVAEVSFDPPKTKASFETNHPHVAHCLQELNLHPLVSLVTPGGKDSICLYLASTAEEVRSLYRKLDKPFKNVWKANFILPP